ncbi:hypothetical protein LTR15_006725 [Elasticomyces elasticus]|nr:hypothetical protein LTR15_006725 [Elasticomyces elasticus]
MAGDEAFRWYISPGCNSGQDHYDGDIFRCGSCGHKACAGCNVAWHEDETCEVYQERIAQENQGRENREQRVRDEEASVETLGRTTKICPNPECRRKLEKSGGCDHFTCKICRHEFCWLCFASQTEIRRIGNTAHTTECKHHSDNITPSFPFNGPLFGGLLGGVGFGMNV